LARACRRGFGGGERSQGEGAAAARDDGGGGPAAQHAHLGAALAGSARRVSDFTVFNLVMLTP